VEKNEKMPTGLTHIRDPDEEQKQFYSSNSQHYINLFGKGLPHYAGLHTQHGSGILGDLYKFAAPAIARTAPHIIRGVKKVISDVQRGRPLKTSVKRRGMDTLKRAAKSLVTGKGRKRKRKPKKKSYQKEAKND
jgi:hypothetical protein